MNNIKITVIIPTYKDWPGLYECIESLKHQTLSRDLFEVIVADNNPEPSKHESINDFVKIIHVPKPGSYSARNAALKISSGELIAFTDSDCIASPSWLENGMKLLDDDRVRVAGKVTLYDKDKVGFTLASCYEKGYSFNQEKNALNGICVTANLLIHKKFILDVGYFNEELMSGGDIDWNKRATQAGIPIVYSEEVEVFHPIRATMNEILKKRLRVMGGTYQKVGVGGLLKMLVPPFKTISLLSNKKNMTIFEKITSWAVCYYLKLYTLVITIALKVKIKKPSRS